MELHIKLRQARLTFHTTGIAAKYKFQTPLKRLLASFYTGVIPQRPGCLQRRHCPRWAYFPLSIEAMFVSLISIIHGSRVLDGSQKRLRVLKTLGALRGGAFKAYVAVRDGIIRFVCGDGKLNEQ